jgi:hypothetical protein
LWIHGLTTSARLYANVEDRAFRIASVSRIQNRSSSLALGSERPLPLNRLLINRKDRLDARANICSILTITVALCLLPGVSLGQTTRTSPSSASTTKNIPLSSSTSPNAPCNPTNPTSPCYSKNAPRDPCYSALTPNEPCSTTTTPNAPSPRPSPSPVISAAPLGSVHALTVDQAKAQIEAEGYSNISGLRKDAKGVWRGKAVKDGLPVDVTLDAEGKVTAN